MKIVHFPHPALRHPARPVTCIDKPLQLAIGEMFDVMYEAKGIGLAAPQVALPWQLLLMNITGDSQQKEAERVFINPVIVERKGIMDGEEGCLSFPGLFTDVKRARRVVVEAYDLKGTKLRIEAEEMAARAWQHEIDHLNGVLFIDRFPELARMTHQRELEAFVSEFRRAQAKGTWPADADIEKALAALEAEMAERA
jgi:peptide deformylase